MALLDVLILSGFIAYAIASGIRSSEAASKDLESYFLASRSLPGWMAGASMAATQFAADTPLLVTGLVATAGIFSLWRLWIYALAFLLMGFVLSGPWRRAGVITDAELTELRYGGAAAAGLRGIKAVYFGTIFNCTVLAMVLLATAVVTETFLLWHAWLPNGVYEPLRRSVAWIGVPLAAGDVPDPAWIRSTDNAISIGLIVLVTTLYSTTGGLRSVVRTDVAQLVIMLAATAGYAGWIFVQVGGPAALLEQLRLMFERGAGPGRLEYESLLAFTPSRAHDASLAVLAVFALQWLVQVNADGTGYLAQRSMACRTDEEAKRAALVFTVIQILLRSLLWIPIALGLLLLFPPDPGLTGEALRLDRERTFVLGIGELPPGLRGLMLTGMLAALASTVDTHLNWGSSYWTNDIYRRFVCPALGRDPADRELVMVARLANLLILIIALLVMTQLSSIQTAWRLSLLLGGGVGVVLVLRWIWWRMNAWGEIACICAALCAAPVLLFGVEDEALRLLLMALVSTAAAVIVALATGPDPREQLVAFYRRVRPPGFWTPIAGHRGPVRRLARGLAATFACAFSIFCLLTAAGTFFFGSPPPTWLPHRGAWLVLLCLVTGALAPVWWRLGKRRRGGHEGSTPASSAGVTEPTSESPDA